MSAPLTKRSVDHSSRESFDFSFHCDRCGKGWHSEQVRFMAGGVSEIDHNEVRNILWAQEHRLAFERANLEAQFHFNHCPVCGRWVCDDCFHVENSTHTDLCVDCAAAGQGENTHNTTHDTKGGTTR